MYLITTISRVLLHPCVCDSDKTFLTVNNGTVLAVIRKGILVLWAAYFGVETQTWSRKSIKYQVNAVKFVGATAELRKANISRVISVHLSTWNNSAPSERIFVKLALEFFWKSLEKIKVSFKSDMHNVYLTFRQIPIYDHNSVSSSEDEKYEGWNFNSGNYLFTTDTK